jgi:hypothetical protein
MAQWRKIYPCMWTSPDLFELDLAEMGMFTALVCAADDEGVVCVDSRWLQAYFGTKRRTTQRRICGLIGKLMDASVMRVGSEAEAKAQRSRRKFAQFTNWGAYQSLLDRKKDRKKEARVRADASGDAHAPLKIEDINGPGKAELRRQNAEKYSALSKGIGRKRKMD